MTDKFTIEVVYALPEKQHLKKIKLRKGSTVKEAILTFTILEFNNSINLLNNKIGIYSRLVELDDIVNEGDRVEIYRPLLSDPRELRRKKAKNSKIKSLKKSPLL